MIEEIKQISEFPDYLVSNHGYVISCKWGKKKVLNTRVNSRGYVEVVLRKDKKSYPKTVHRLVMQTFSCTSDLVIDHIDNNKLNNRLDNLQYLSDRDNLLKYHKMVSPNKEFKYAHINWLNRGKKWRIAVMKNGKRVIVGYHKDIEQAKIIQDAYKATNLKTD